MNFFADSPEWKYLVRYAIDWDALLPLYYPQYPTVDGFQGAEDALSFFEDLLSSSGRWTGDTLAGRARHLDQVGCGELVDGGFVPSKPLAKTLEEVRELGLAGLCVDRSFGGLGVPLSIGILVFQQVSRACIATSAQLAFTTSFADMLERFADEAIKAKFVPLVRSGQLSGSMCITEPGSGSDVGSLRTCAEKMPDGTYRINGTKCFITNGGGGLALILARIKGAPEGLAGLSLFFAQEWREDSPGDEKRTRNYRLTKLEEKLGMHGSATCEVVYEDTIGVLIGGENQGFKMMLHLMNEARLSVGFQGIGSMEAALSQVLEYAAARAQFGKPLLDLPLYRNNVAAWQTEVDAFRAFMVDTLSHFDACQRLDLKKRHTGDLSEAETALHRRSLKAVRRRTPLAKYYGTEAAARLTLKAIQAFGGYGYMQDYDVERIHRDAIGSLLYEGTSQIQSLMAMKDFVKSMMDDPGKFLQSLVGAHPLGGIGDAEVKRGCRQVIYEFRKNVAGLVIRCFKPGSSANEGGLRETLDQMRKAFRKQYWQEAERFDRLMVHAETLCEALSYVETLKVLQKHALKDRAREDLFYRYASLVRPRLAGIYEGWRQE